MDAWLQQLLQRPDLGSLLAIPFVAAFVGWFTNWLAIEMTFKPLHFAGSRRLGIGWQGIIPAKAGKMAGVIVDNSLARLASMSELFRELEPESIAEHITRNVNRHIDEYVDDIMRERDPVLWEKVPMMVRSRVHARARRQLPDIMDNIIEDMSANIEELLDVRAMVIDMMREDPALVVRVFREVGARELRFVVNSGAWFGFVFGLGQMAWYGTTSSPWLMPAFGFVVGWATNWLALNLVFRPLEPIWLGPYCIQGLFMQRKDEVSAKFAEICTRDIITLRNVMTEVLSGRRADRTKAIIKRHMRPLLDAGVVRAALQLALGAEGYVELKRDVADRAVEASLNLVSDARFSRERTGNIRELLRKRLQEMNNREFQTLLLPAFKEDEWTLIALGALLGGLAGLVQLLVMQFV